MAGCLRYCLDVAETGPVRLNLGAGMQYRPGWINYDRSRAVMISRRPWLRRLMRLAGHEMQPWPANTRSHDLTKGVPHSDQSVDVIYTSHFLEHIWLHQAQFFLQECHRVLKPRGLIRVVVPDLELVARNYLAGDLAFFNTTRDLPADAFLDALLLRPYRTGSAPERLFRRIVRSDEEGHRWMYDATSMTRRLRDAGFAEIQVVDYQQGRDPEVAALDFRPRDSLHIEAVRPDLG